VPYSAGTVILQVVPSYLGFQEKNKEMADALAKSLEEGLDEGAEKGAKKASSRISKILGEETSKGSAKAGEESADQYVGAFRKKLTTAVSAMQREVKPIQLSVDQQHLAADLARAKTLLKELSTTKITPEMDTTELRAKAVEARKILETLTKDATVEIKGDAGAAIAAAKSFEKYVDGLDLTAKLKVDTSAAERKMGSFEKKLKEQLTKAMSAIGTSGSRELQELQARLQALNLKKIGIDVTGEQAKKEISSIERDLARLAATSTSVQIHADATEALAALESTERAREKLEHKKAVQLKVKADTKAAAANLSLLDKALKKVGIDGRDAANSFRFFNFTALATASIGVALIPIIATLAAGVGGLAVAAFAGAAGLGILGVAFSGLGDAVSALGEQQDSAAKEGEAAAKRQQAAARSVADAQRSLARAVEDASQRAAAARENVSDAERSLARVVEDAAERNEDASHRVADAKQQAARSVESALRQQESAERRLSRSQSDAAEAQRDLTRARVEAQKELEDIAMQQRRNALDERQGVIDLFNATVEDSAARLDPGATNLEKEQAAINLANAKLQLEEIRKRGKELAEQSKKGVDNSDRVVTAQERVTEALAAQREAVRDLQEADAEVTRTRLDGARQIKDAIDDQNRAFEDGQEAISDARRNVARAEQDARRSTVDSQQAIADAQRNLKEAQQDYTAAVNETSASTDRVATAMSKLGPAGQAFALFIHSLRDDFREIRDIIQTAFLPKLTEAIKILMNGAGPDFKKFVGDMASLFGDLAVESAKVFTNPTWDKFWETIAEVAPVLTKDFGRAFLAWLTIFAVLATALAPIALEMAEAFADWSESVLAWAKSPEGQKAIADFLAYVREVAPDVKEFFKALIDAIENLAEGLAPYGEKLLKGITDFLDFIADMDPEVLGAIAITVLELVAAFQLLSGALVLLQVASGPLGLIAIALAALVVGFIYFYNTNEDFAAFVDRAWPAIQEVVKLALEIITEHVSAVAAGLNIVIDVVEKLWHEIFEPFLSWVDTTLTTVFEDTIEPILTDFAELFVDLGGDISYVWNKIIWPVLSTMGRIIGELWWLIAKPTFELIAEHFDKLGIALKFTFDTTIGPLFTLIAKALGLDERMAENGGGLVGAFRTGIDIIKTIWDGLGILAKKPVEFLVDTIMNKSIIAGFNTLAGHLPGLKTIDPIPWPPPGFANGTARVPDSSYGVRFGYSPGRDNQIIAVGGGEAVLRPELSRALGTDWINAANKRAKLHGVQGAINFLGGFKNGIADVGGGGTRTNNAFGDFDKTTWKGEKFNFRTIRMLQAAERLLGASIRITQGSYSTRVSASGSTHAGGGAFDAGWPASTSVGERLVAILRTVGFAAWHRNPSQGPWNHHIHGIAIGDPTASQAAQNQVKSYFAGGDGLGGRDDGPKVPKDPSLLDRIGSGVSGILGWVADAISNPVDWLKGKITGKLEQLTKEWGDNTLTKTLKAIPEAVINGMSQLISGFIPGSGDVGGPSDIKSMVQQLAASAFGWAGNQWKALERLVHKESSWNPNAQNPTSSAYGLFQFLDGTWGPYGSKTSDPRLQAQYGMQYIKDRYGDPESALRFHEGHNWYSDGGVVPDNGTMMYDNGGYLPPGVTQVVNLTGKPEPVFTADQFENLGARGGAGGTWHYEPHFEGSDLTAHDVMEDFAFELRRFGRGS
jgi:hypothetical protein